MYATHRLARTGMAALALSLAMPLGAQEFGRNNVRYESFDFQVLKTERFDIYYYPQEEQAVRHAARMSERWYARLSRVLNHQFVQRQPLILYATHPHFWQTNTLGGGVGEGTGGATEVFKRRIVMPFAGPLGETDHVLGHELVHAFQYDITGRRGSQLPTAVQLPLWFIEGMAEYLSVGPVDPHTAMWMRDAARRERLPTIRQLGDPRYFPYRYGQALWSFVAGRWGDDAVGNALRIAGRTPDAEKALEEVTGLKSEELSKEWHAAVREAYAPVFAATQPATRYGRALITDDNAGELNVGPSLSPDGRHLVFLSEKSLFAIEMFLADAQTGRVRKKIVETAVDPHFDSLEFIRSSGGWAPDSRRFVFAAVHKGRPVLSVLDTERAEVVQEVRLPQLGEIFDPSFSPDGQSVVFSANTGGLLDLWVYDLRAGRLRRLTDDAFAELQPAWSPDGRTIAFSTDRFTSRLEDLYFGDYRLAALDVATGAVRELPSFAGAKNIDPQWSTDGSSLYFIADRNGISNVYRLELAGGRHTQVTDLLTGVTGITALSPALTVGGSRVAFSVYEEDQHRIYSVESPAVQAGSALQPVDRRAAALPPLERRQAEVARLTQNTTLGLPAPRTFPVTDYEPRLSLDFVGQPTLAVGRDPFGTYVGGGVSFLFSDMLGNHRLAAVVQASGRVEDIGGVVAYENRRTRWNLGASLESIPYVTGAFATGVAAVDGQSVFIQRSDLFRETHRSLTGYAAYPFSRAQRFEVGASYRHISFGREVLTEFFDPGSGQFLGREEEDLDAPGALSLGQGSAALVYDTSIFGATSPILGRRYRLEALPTVGSINFTGVLADVRQYVMPLRPYTFAARVLHYGRYGAGGEDPRLTSLYLGYPQLVRGYDFNSFDASECVSAVGDCPVFDQLIGSRLLIGNFELRFPLFGAFGARSFYGPLPIELLAFADAGVAWSRGQSVRFERGSSSPTERRFVTSVGTGFRFNVFGYAVIEVDYVKPLDRPNKGWIWQFNLSPGF
ncbi:MAG TPA: BamA/TamA family outer membrane protein [Vicinamibacteria bacterium]|nr:BamA/TamA family outer membrane protein [Vicinamibacteria bacterium]